jgi:hypothetical protein
LTRRNPDISLAGTREDVIERTLGQPCDIDKT